MEVLRKILIIVMFSFIFFSGKAQIEVSNQLINNLFSMLEHNEYFELRRVYNNNERKLPSAYALYFSAYINAAFNAPENSNDNINELLKLPPGSLKSEQMLDIFSVKLQNHINMYEYQQAWQTTKFITSTYYSLLDSTTLAEFKNTEKLWESLIEVQKQDIEINSNATIDLLSDKVGLYNVKTEINSISENYVFDTGANLSVMQRSQAKKLGLEIQDVNFQTLAITGKSIESDIAIVPMLKIGEMTFGNVIFIILDDDELKFPANNYEIKGIIGYPVIRAMQEIHVTKDNKLKVPREPKHYSENNFALNGLTPIVEVKCNNVNTPFVFDTGATNTVLYNKYYLKNKTLIDKKHKLQTFSVGSAGGVQELQGYHLKKINLQVGNRKANLKKGIDIIVSENSKNFEVYGNLGQDFINQFDGYTISFKYSSIVFE